jgi:haloacetate dehalogenase
MILADPKVYIDGQMGNRYAGLGVFHPDAYKYYLKVVGERDAVHGMCEDHRAAASIDLEEARDDIKNGRQIQCPLRVLWGKHGIIERCFDAVEEWQSVSSSTVEGEPVESGHYLPEELLDVLLKNIKEFLVYAQA